MLLALRRPGSGTGESAAIERGIARTLWGRREIRILSGLAFLGFGVFVALSTWLQTLLQPAGVSETEAGGAAGRDGRSPASSAARCCPPRSSRRGAERRFMWAVVLVGGLGSVALAFVPGIAGKARRAGRDGCRCCYPRCP